MIVIYIIVILTVTSRSPSLDIKDGSDNDTKRKEIMILVNRIIDKLRQIDE